MKLLLVLGILYFVLFVPTHQQGRRIPPAVQSQSSQNVGSRRGSSEESRQGASRGQPRPPDDDEDDEDSGSDEKFTCPRADGLYADPSSCKKFYLCGSWHAWAQSCPPSLYFDDKLKFCTFKTAQLTCGPITEEEVRNEEAKTQQTNYPVCDQSKCQLPNCYCSDEGVSIPGNLAPNQVPQMVLLSFSGAVNELVFDHYKKVLGYSAKFSAQQTRNNPNGCGARATFFVNHEYSNYAQIQWLATQGHEIGLHSITHRLPELWWTDKANYSDWAEEIIGMREIILSLTGGSVLSRDNLVGMRVPYVKPGGDVQFEMGLDFGLLYDSSISAPRGSPPYWPFTLDYRQPFDCSSNPNRKTEKPDESNSGEGLNQNFRQNRPNRPKREVKFTKNNKKKFVSEKKPFQWSKFQLSRPKRQSPFLGRPLRCPTKPYAGFWEVPINPLWNDVNTCHHADQCVFPSNDEDSTDIFDFLLENFERHYSTNRAPFQLNFHVTWFTSKTHIRALQRFLDYVQQNFKDVWFVTFQQMIQWVKNPQPVNQLDHFKCENKTVFPSCNRPQTCVLKHYLDKENNAATEENAVRSDTRYMQICHPIACPQQFPWFGNYAGRSKDFKTIMQLVEEAVGTEQGK